MQCIRVVRLPDDLAFMPRHDHRSMVGIVLPFTKKEDEKYFVSRMELVRTLHFMGNHSAADYWDRPIFAKEITINGKSCVEVDD